MLLAGNIAYIYCSRSRGARTRCATPPFNVAKATVPLLVAHNRGEFVSYASMAGHWPTLYFGAYAASKSVLIAFTEVLYHENRGRGVKFVCVCRLRWRRRWFPNVLWCVVHKIENA